MKFERTVVSVDMIMNAVYGMRNPKNSWSKSDSFILRSNIGRWNEEIKIGPADLKLMRTLIKSGTDHSKFMRQIPISVQITAPAYWWPEMDQYKVGTVTNSTSKMHKLLANEITQECFENPIDETTLNHLESVRKLAVEEREKGVSDKNNKWWKKLLNELPHGWLQTRMWSANYQTLRNIYFARRNHRQSEWDDFRHWIETLPYANELICYDPKKVEPVPDTLEEIMKREG